MSCDDWCKSGEASQRFIYLKMAVCRGAASWGWRTES